MFQKSGIREILMAMIFAQPIRSLLIGFRKVPYGHRILNRIAFPLGIFPSFAEAWESAKKTNLPGHEDPEEISVHLEISRTLRPSDYAVLYWLNLIGSEVLRVFDYGGNVGNLFYAYKSYLEKFQDLHWRVFDIPSVVEHGRGLASARGATQLTFARSQAEARADDVLLVSGAFHYWEGNIREFVNQFPDPPLHILINRTPVLDSEESYFTVQTTSTCAFPCIVRNVNSLIAEFAEVGYELRDRWTAQELSLKPVLCPDKWVWSYSGFYFRKARTT